MKIRLFLYQLPSPPALAKTSTVSHHAASPRPPLCRRAGPRGPQQGRHLRGVQDRHPGLRDPPPHRGGHHGADRGHEVRGVSPGSISLVNKIER